LPSSTLQSETNMVTPLFLLSLGLNGTSKSWSQPSMGPQEAKNRKGGIYVRGRFVESFTTVFPSPLPPEENVIQGLGRPEDFIKQPPKKKPRQPTRNQKKKQRKMPTPICGSCDFWDKKYSFCIIQRLTEEKPFKCPFINGKAKILVKLPEAKQVVSWRGRK